jgi:hypothetical protein
MKVESHRAGDGAGLVLVETHRAAETAMGADGLEYAIGHVTRLPRDGSPPHE